MGQQATDAHSPDNSYLAYDVGPLTYLCAENFDLSKRCALSDKEATLDAQRLPLSV